MKWDQGQAALGGPSTRRVHSHYMDGVDIPLKDFPGRDAMIQRIIDQLRYTVQARLASGLQEVSIQRGDVYPLVVEIINTITGHNAPSGTIFERQMWVQAVVVNERGDTIFSSGLLDPLGDLLNEHSEYVSNGRMAYDSSLVMFHGKAFRLGKEIPFFFDADAISNLTIPPFEARYARYKIRPDMYGSSTNLTINVKLYMRALPPYFLRKLGHTDLVKYLPQFLMEELSQSVEIR
jgi:hypothetical protein